MLKEVVDVNNMSFLVVCATVLVLLPFAFASINTTCLPSNEGTYDELEIVLHVNFTFHGLITYKVLFIYLFAVDLLREIGKKLGKDWDFEQDPCVGWQGPSNRTYDDNLLCSPDRPLCHVTSM